jgi:hypothetical protein
MTPTILVMKAKVTQALVKREMNSSSIWESELPRKNMIAQTFQLGMNQLE